MLHPRGDVSFSSRATKNSQKISDTKKNDIKNGNKSSFQSNYKNQIKGDVKSELQDVKCDASTRRTMEMEKFKVKVSEKSQKFKLFALLTFKKYGKLGAITYFGVYLTTLAGFTIASYNGFLSSEDIKKGLKLLHMEHIKCPDLDGKFGRFLVAYVACKMAEPIRLVATIIIVTLVSRIMSIRAIKGTLAK